MEGGGMDQVIGQWILIGIVVAFQAFDKVKAWMNNGNGKRPINGNSNKFLNHEGRISSLEATMKIVCLEIEKMRKENREDHEKLFEKLRELG